MKKNQFAVTLTIVLMLLICQFSFASDTVLNTELVTNGGAETGSISGWVDNTGASRWSASETYSNWAVPAAGSYYFFLYNPSMDVPLSGTMSQEIALTDTSGLFTSISDGNVSINFSISMFQKISAGNEAKAILEEYDAGGALLKTSQVVNTTTSGAMGPYQLNTQLQPNTRKLKVFLSATLTKGGYAQFDKVSLQLTDASAKSAPVFGGDFPTSAETDAAVTYGPIPFTISDPDAGDINNLTFSASSSNINLAPASNIIIGGSGTNRTLTIVPAGNLSGEADITVSASDGTKSADKTFHFTVHKVISMNTNLVENSNATNEFASWSGSTVNISATGDGFSLISPGAGMYQNLDISKFSGLIDGGETQFNMSASFTATYGVVSARFYTDIACTNPIGSVFTVNSGTTSLQHFIPANAKGVQITMTYTSGVYATVIIRNISFQIVNDFPKISPVSDKTTQLSLLTVPVSAYYTTSSALLTATSSDQTIVPDAGIAVGGSGYYRTVTFTPLKNGTVTITVTLNDGTTSSSRSFNVTALEPTAVSNVDMPTAGYYASGGQLDFTVHFNNNITGGADSTLPLTIGGVSASASYLSNTANSITYRYTITDSDTGAVAIGTEINDSSSPITDTAGYDAIMDISSGTTSVTVVQAPLVTSTSASTTYGDKITFFATLTCADSLTGTLQFKANGTNLGTPVNVIGNTASFETAENLFEAGLVSITAEFVPSDSDSYFSSLTSSTSTVTVLPKPVSVSGFTADAKTYDGTTDVTLSGGTLTGILARDDLSAVYPTVGTAAAKNFGSRAVSFAAIMLAGADKDNYVLSVQPTVSVAISPKAVTATVSIADKVYNGNTTAMVSCNFDSGHIVSGDDIAVTVSGNFDTKDVGTGKAVSISVPSITITGTDKDNYSVTVPTSGTADITPLALTVTPKAAAKTYGQDDPALTFEITSGTLVASETLSGSLSRAVGEDVNDYEITQDTLTSTNNPNYIINFAAGVKLTITQATPVVTVSVDNASQITGKEVVVTVTVTYPNKKGTDAYPAAVLITPVNASAKDTITVNGNQYIQTFTLGNDLATPAAFSASVASYGNYAGADSTSPATVAIADRYTPTVSVTSNKGSSVTYGDMVTFTASVSDPNGTPQGTVQFFVDTSACSGEVTLANGTASLLLSADPLTAGIRSITARYTPTADETDYKTNTSSAFSLTVNKKTVAITGLSAVARDYDGTVNVVLAGGAISGMLDGAALTANIPTTGTAAEKNVGLRAVSFTAITLDGTDKDNYLLSVQPTVSVNISPKAIPATITVSSKNYDGNTNATVHCGLNAGGIVAGDMVTVSATGSFDNKDAGTGKTVIIGSVIKSGTDKDNYNITVPTSDSADISPLAITVTPDAATKIYGQDDPVLTFKITSGTLVASENLVGGLKRDSGEDVGTYEIKQDDTLNDARNPNYEIRFTTAKIYLSISQATPVVTVTSSKANPVYGDPVTFTATTQKSGSGTFPTGSVQFLIDGTPKGTVALTDGTASYTTTQTELLPGNVNVTALYTPDTGEKNYSANTSAAYTMTVAKREVTVKADDKTIYVGKAIPATESLTYTVTGLIGSDTLAALPTLRLPADVDSRKKDDFIISIMGAAVSGNYTIKMVNGTLQVINMQVSDSTPSQTSSTVVALATTQTEGIAAASVTNDQISQATTAALQKASQEGISAIVEIKVQGVNHADAVAVTVSKAAVDSMMQRGLDGLRLDTSVGTLTFDANALSAISQSAIDNIKLQVEALDHTELPEEVRESIGDRPVFDFTITSKDETISSFGEGSVTVSIPYALKDGENPNAIVVYYLDAEGNMTPVHSRYNPETGAAVFTVTHFSRYAIGYNMATFYDVFEGSWYYDAVTFCAAREITTGIGNNMFGPEATLTRGQFIVLLMRAYGLAPDENPVENFTDAGNSYYTGHLASAKRLGIANGATNNLFMPEKEITRQDVFTLLYRALDVLGELPKTESATALSDFSDASKISDYAIAAVNRFVASGIISGSEGKLNPLGCSTRAQMTAVLYNLLSK